METIREPFDNSADASPVVFFLFSFATHTHTHTTAENLHSVYVSQGDPRFGFIPLGRNLHTRNCSNDSYYSRGCRGRQNTSFCGHRILVRAFRYAPRARIRPDSENIRFASWWPKSGGRGTGGKSERDSAIIKESEQMADVGAALK